MELIQHQQKNTNSSYWAVLDWVCVGAKPSFPNLDLYIHLFNFSGVGKMILRRYGIEYP